MDKYFLILLYFSLQHSKILAAKTSLLTWLAIPRLFLFFLLVLVFSSLQTDKSTSCVARMFVLKCGHLKYFLMCDFLKYISLCCLPGPMPKYSSNGCSRKTKDRDPEHHFLWNPQAVTFSLAAHPWQQTLPVLLQSLWAVRSDQNPLPTTPPHVIVQWSNLSESDFAQHFFFFLSREVVIQQKIKCTQFTSSFPLIPLLPFLTGNIRHSVIQVVKCLRTQHVFSSSAVVLPGEVTASGPHPAFSRLSLGRSCHQICQNHVPLTDVFVPTAELLVGLCESEVPRLCSSACSKHSAPANSENLHGMFKDSSSSELLGLKLNCGAAEMVSWASTKRWRH